MKLQIQFDLTITVDLPSRYRIDNVIVDEILDKC
jgi:hypothetical protein